MLGLYPVSAAPVSTLLGTSPPPPSAPDRFYTYPGRDRSRVTCAGSDASRTTLTGRDRSQSTYAVDIDE